MRSSEFAKYSLLLWNQGEGFKEFVIATNNYFGIVKTQAKYKN